MPHGINENDVFKAADSLLAQGLRPTIERVRHELGRGSPNTVNRLLDLWWQSLSQRIKGKVDVKGRLPAELLTQVEALQAEIRRSVLADASKILAEQQRGLADKEQALQERATQIEAEKAGVHAAITAQQDELIRWRAQSAEQDRTLVELRASSASAQKESARLTKLLDAAKAEGAELQKTHRAELSRIRLQSEAQEKHWLQEIDRLRQDLRAAKFEAKQHAVSLKRQREELRRQSIRSQLAEVTSHRTIEQLQKQINDEHAGRIKAETRASAQQELAQALKAISRTRIPRKAPSHRTMQSPSLTLVHSD